MPEVQISSFFISVIHRSNKSTNHIYRRTLKTIFVLRNPLSIPSFCLLCHDFDEIVFISLISVGIPFAISDVFEMVCIMQASNLIYRLQYISTQQLAKIA